MVLILCFCFGGVGTIMAGFLIKKRALLAALVIGSLQIFFVWFFLLGWVWAIHTGFIIYKNSK